MMDARTVREVIDDVRRLLHETTSGDDLVARAGEVRARLRAALEAVQAGGVEAGAEVTGFQRSLHEEVADAERKIRDNPLGAVVVAAGLGLLLGLLLRRR
jgi:ElaB/YqjD/DUF883 family membrane-anchored ribosome-binding protein